MDAHSSATVESPLERSDPESVHSNENYYDNHFRFQSFSDLFRWSPRVVWIITRIDPNSTGSDISVCETAK